MSVVPIEFRDDVELLRLPGPKRDNLICIFVLLSKYINT